MNIKNKKTMKKILGALLMVSLFSGCLKKNDSEFRCTYNDCAIVAPAAEVQQVQDYLTANNLTATKHCSGLFYTVVNEGTGTRPTVCNNIAFTYVGKLTNGTTFDEATSPVVFNLSQLITGFKNGIPLIKAGGSIRLYVPPTLGYGSRQAGTIPPNSILVFDVGLAGVQ